MPDVREILTTPTFLLKFLELALGIICTVLLAGESLKVDDVKKMVVVFGAVIGYIMINIICILSHIFEPRLNRIVLLIIAFSGFIMLIASGALICGSFEVYTTGGSKFSRIIPAGVVAFVNSLVYAGDAGATFMQRVA